MRIYRNEGGSHRRPSLILRIRSTIANVPNGANILGSCAGLILAWYPISTGSLYQNILLAIVTSYIFFVFVVAWPKSERSLRLKKLIHGWIEGIVLTSSGSLAQICRFAEVSIRFEHLDEEALKRAMAKLPANGQILQSFPTTWLSSLDSSRRSTQRLAGRLLLHAEYLDDQTIRLVAAIDDCSHFNSIERDAKQNWAPTVTLENWSHSYAIYCNLCNQLSLHSTMP